MRNNLKYYIGEEKMKQIKEYVDEVKDYYYIDEDGIVIDTRSGEELKADNDHKYYLMIESNRKKKYTIKYLYRACYDEEFIFNEIPCEDGEEWKVIEDTSKTYYVSNMGRVFSKRKKYIGIIMTPNINESGYYRLQIYYNDKRRDKLLHDLVAEYFLDKPLPIPLKGYNVHHIDGDKLNCCADNLMILTTKKHSKIHRDNDKRKEVE